MADSSLVTLYREPDGCSKCYQKTHNFSPESPNFRLFLSKNRRKSPNCTFLLSCEETISICYNNLGRFLSDLDENLNKFGLVIEVGLRGHHQHFEAKIWRRGGGFQGGFQTEKAKKLAEKSKKNGAASQNERSCGLVPVSYGKRVLHR